MRIMDIIKAKMYELEGNFKEALKVLTKIKFKNNLTLKEKITLNNKIAQLNWKLNNDIAYKYLQENKEIFDNKLNRENYKISYAKYLWLYAEVFERELSDKQYKKIFNKIYKIYKGISEYYSSLAVLKILERKGNKKYIDNYINYVINTSSDAMLINVMIEKSHTTSLSYIKKISINQQYHYFYVLNVMKNYL